VLYVSRTDKVDGSQGEPRSVWQAFLHRFRPFSKLWECCFIATRRPTASLQVRVSVADQASTAINPDEVYGYDVLQNRAAAFPARH
jgi:hypothetical protein